MNVRYSVFDGELLSFTSSGARTSTNVVTATGVTVNRFFAVTMTWNGSGAAYVGSAGTHRTLTTPGLRYCSTNSGDAGTDEFDGAVTFATSASVVEQLTGTLDGSSRNVDTCCSGDTNVAMPGVRVSWFSAYTEK